MNNGSTPARQPSRKHAWFALVLLAVLLLAGIALRYTMQPQHATRLVLDQVGRTLGLRITASGTAQYSLRGGPSLVIRDVVAQEPGAAIPLLRADRIMLSLPWSTVRGLTTGSAGSTIVLHRVELDRPILDVDAFQHWLQRRPPGKTRSPQLTQGMRVTDGRVVAQGWSMGGLVIDVPRLVPEQPVTARIAGRYRSAALQLPFNLHIALSRPANDTALGLAGTISIERGSWRLPSHIVLSGRLHVGDGWQLQRARLASASRYESGRTSLPFTAGLAGTLRSADARTAFAPMGLVVHGADAIPDLSGSGRASLSTVLDLRLTGMLPAWPPGWPGLPSPIADSKSPIPFSLQYNGRPDLSDVAALHLSRDATRFDGRLRPVEFANWIQAGSTGSPIPPIDGRMSTPRLDIAGAQLQGVDVTIGDDEPNAVPTR